MFISRKKFEEAIQKAREETMDRVYQDRMISDIHTRIEGLERRIYKLEHPNGEKAEKTIKPIGIE